MLPEIKISEMHKYIEFFLFPVLESSLNFHFSMFSYSVHKWIASWTLFRLDFPSNTLLFFLEGHMVHSIISILACGETGFLLA